MDITLYVTENAEFEGEDPAYVSVEMKEKGTNLRYFVAKDLVGYSTEYVYDNYMVNLLSYEVRNLVKPSIDSTFKNKKVQFLTKVSLRSDLHKKLTEKKIKWEYKNVKNNCETQVFLLIPDTKEYQELAIKYIQAQHKSSKIKVDDYDLYFYSGKYDAKIRYVRVNSAKIGEFNTVKKFVAKLESASLLQYKNDTRSLVKQTKLYK
ncbi:hypothetical protein [Bacillus rubiinfantis]|uniref:hypothetical protein n=1 Tax=Bacillus rubiinfantis TaxID=1499680 RepID=UPI0005A62E98|nr:hypothetical protein [Bacillus rubiinfantis]